MRRAKLKVSLRISCADVSAKVVDVKSFVVGRASICAEIAPTPPSLSPTDAVGLRSIVRFIARCCWVSWSPIRLPRIHCARNMHTSGLGPSSSLVGQSCERPVFRMHVT